MANYSTRSIAAEILAEVFTDQQSLTELLKNNIPPKISAEDKGFIQELCFGVLRWYWQLESIANSLISKPLKAKDNDIYALILLGLYQLIHLQTAEHAAIYETVQATRILKKNWATSFLNGVLRNFQREQQRFLNQTQKSLTSLYSHPKWLIEAIQKAWPNDWQAILNANNHRPPMTLRVNHLQQTTANYLAQLQEKNIDVKANKFNDCTITLEKAQDVKQLPGFMNGDVSVQDAAGQFAAQLLELKPNLSVLDACSAPGGKFCHILETEPQLNSIIGVELDETRIKRVEENLERLNLKKLNVQIKNIAADVAQPDKWWDGNLFDRILLDAPCSATGVIRRHPDIKFLRRPSDIKELVTTQMNMLNALWPLLKSGGILLYATCSILPQENSDLIQNFLQLHSDAKEKVIETPWGVNCKVGKQILTGDHNMDGFYYARLEKV